MEDFLAERGVRVSYEAIRLWCRTFGPAFAAGLRRRRARAGDKWHLDEVQLKITGRKHWLWRAVEQDGLVLDILVQERRNQEAAELFLRRVVDGQGYRPRVVVTDKLASYPPAIRRVLPGVEHRRQKGAEHPRGALPSAHSPARTRAPAVQIARARPAVPPSIQSPLRSLPPTAARAVISFQPPSTTRCCRCCRPASARGAPSRASPRQSGRAAGANTPLRLPC